MVMKMQLCWLKMSNETPNLLKVTLSILSSFIGIQSNKNRVRDFKSGSPAQFIIIGIIITILLIILLYNFVKLVLIYGV